MPGLKKKKVRLGNEIVQATVIPIVEDKEYFNAYLLDDGSLIRIKLCCQQILRVDDRYDEDGNPVYIVRSTNITSVDSPDDLIKDTFI